MKKPPNKRHLRLRKQGMWGEQRRWWLLVTDVVQSSIRVKRKDRSDPRCSAEPALYQDLISLIRLAAPDQKSDAVEPALLLMDSLALSTCGVRRSHQPPAKDGAQHRESRWSFDDEVALTLGS